MHSEVASSPVDLQLGSEYGVSDFVLRNHRLDVVAQGMTPNRLSLEPGGYSVELTNGGLSNRRLFEAKAGEFTDLSSIDIPVDTLVPVSNAAHRRQQDAEFATLVSASLGSAAAQCGMVVLPVLHSTTGPGRIQHEGDGNVKIQVFDSQHRLVPRDAEVVFEGYEGKKATPYRVTAGGYILRIDSQARSVEMPVWAANGYQVLVFVPSSGNEALDRVSIELVPLGSPWTGFDVASNLYESYRRRLAMGRLRVNIISSDWAIRQTRARPMLGLLWAHMLKGTSNTPNEMLKLLLGELELLMPGLPDLAVLSNRRSQVSFPPLVASGFWELVNRSSNSGSVFLPGSLVDDLDQAAVQLGVWTTWRPLEYELASSHAKLANPKHHRSPKASDDVEKGPRAYLTRISRLVALAAAPVLYVGYVVRLYRAPNGLLARMLESVDGNQLVESRARLYLRELALVGERRRLLRILRGRPEELASACHVSRRTSKEVVDRVIVDLRQCLKQEGRT